MILSELNNLDYRLTISLAGVIPPRREDRQNEKEKPFNSILFNSDSSWTSHIKVSWRQVQIDSGELCYTILSCVHLPQQNYSTWKAQHANSLKNLLTNWILCTKFCLVKLF